MENVLHRAPEDVYDLMMRKHSVSAVTLNELQGKQENDVCLLSWT